MLNNNESFGSAANRFWRVYKNNGSGFNSSFVAWPTPSGGQFSSNGSSLGYVYPIGAGGCFEQGCQTWNFADLNNDQKPELVVLSEYSSALAAYSQYGVGTSPFWKVYYNTGNGFANWVHNWPTPAGGYNITGGINIGFTNFNTNPISPNGSQGWRVTDVNNDAQPDLVVTGEYDSSIFLGVQFGLPSSPHWKVYLGNGVGLPVKEYTRAADLIHVFPNPTEGHINFTSEYNLNGKPYQLVNIFGVTVISGILNNAEGISLKDLAAGMYFLHIMDESSLRAVIVKQ